MALPGIPWLLLSILVAVAPVPCTCEQQACKADSLLQCFDPAGTVLAHGTEFRASLLPLLGALPCAAAPTGFASLRSDRAFARGLCFADDTAPPSECVRCLSAAAENLTAGCGTTTRRAGIWTSGCFLSYADTDTSSPREDAFRELLLLSDSGDDDDTDTDDNLHHMLVAIAQAVAQRAAGEISGTRMLATVDAETVTSVVRHNSSYYLRSKVLVVAQCARDGGAADCVRCLQDSARAVEWDCGDLVAARDLVAVVVGFNISSLSPEFDGGGENNCESMIARQFAHVQGFGRVVSTTLVPQKRGLDVLMLCIGLGASGGLILACLCGFIMGKREKAKRKKMDAAVAGEYIN